MDHLRLAVFSLGSVLAFALPTAAHAFPPYRSTDAETAGDDVVELRLGLLRIQRSDGQSTRLAPLSRLNIGMGDRFEIVNELEYAPDDRQLDEGALGFKWARLDGTLGFGVETLALLPVRSDQGGAGVESQFLTTLKHDEWRVHFNAGAFYDPRGDETVRGWRGSVLAEFPRERWRPGIELFARRAHGGDTRSQLGFGAIAQLERIEIRTGIHVGLSDAAPDIEGSVWLSWSWERGDADGPRASGR
jgi:hypothetical protein